MLHTNSMMKNSNPIDFELNSPLTALTHIAGGAFDQYPTVI